MSLRLGKEDVDRAAGAGRYHRQTLIDWWRQDRLASARVLVVGAGALGNEILKLLALLGAGRVLVYDMDRIEESNLSRSVLFRDGDEGRAKVDVAVERLRELNPRVLAEGRRENVVFRGGLGVFHWAEVVISGVDNREARVFVNAACARVGKAWIDGAIEGLDGVARVFDPATGPCYECTMNATDRALLAERRSCAMLARDVVARGHVPSTAVAASIIAALQVQEAVKALHGQRISPGEGIHVNGLSCDVSRIRYQRREECGGHERSERLVPLGCGVADTTFGELLERAERTQGRGATLDFSRDVVLSLECPSCGGRTPGRAVLGEIRESDAACPRCGVHRVVETASSAYRGGPVDLAATPAAVGLPPYDVLVARHGVDSGEAWIFDGDAGSVLGSLYEPGRDARRDSEGRSPV